MSFLNGTDPGLRQTRTPTTDNFAAGVDFTAGSTTQLTLSADPGSEDNVEITFDGIQQHRNTYSVSGTTVTFDAAIGSGVTNVEATFTTTIPAATPANSSVGTSQLADNGVTLAKLAGGTAGKLIGFDGSGDPAEISGGKVIQVVTAGTSAVATTTTTMPSDDTIPQNTEGAEIETVSITPTSTSNILYILVTAMISGPSDDQQIVCALFQDSTADALAAVHSEGASGARLQPVNLHHSMTAGTTSATTFKVRGGSSAGGTVTFQGAGGSRKFGGVGYSRITVMEIEP